LEGQSPAFATLQLFYYALTSMTTIGLGDFNPKSNVERFFIAFGLLLGVLV